ncbi:metalloregulator ArsR/SmtB family transcription factor [Microlunatus ginsengisoli]|uniref:Metalloregulator ArsR/SmtB family transcription factor n=1 Tax=Microlunatus ginsengisoli TaxID=363863 RepID=A0ABP6ZRF1_9ACTN
MGVFEALADPVRRLMVESLATGEQPAGDLVALARARFGISQPAGSQHLRVLREHEVVAVRAEGTRRWYAVRPEALSELDVWLDRFRRTWDQPLDALATELARGRRQRRIETSSTHSASTEDRAAT